MKRRKERLKRFEGALHERKAVLNVHISKELKKTLKTKKRSVLVNKGDTVIVMRGSNKGKTGKVNKVSHIKGLVYLEGVTKRNVRGVENMIPFQPSNLQLTALKESPYRKELFKGE